MSQEEYRSLMDKIPEATKEKDQIPNAYSILRDPDILLENDGFSTRVVYTLDNVYMHLANIVGNMARVRADGIEMRIARNSQSNKPRIEIFLLVNTEKSLNASFAEKDGQPSEVVYRPTQIGFLQQNLNAWSYSNLEGNVEIIFQPISAGPMDRVNDSKKDGQVVIGYGSPQTMDVVDYAVGKQGSRKEMIESHRLLDDETITSAMKEIVNQVTKKLSSLKDDRKI